MFSTPTQKEYWIFSTSFLVHCPSLASGRDRKRDRTHLEKFNDFGLL